MAWFYWFNKTMDIGAFQRDIWRNGETELETAIREVKEETNIDVIPNEKKRYVQEYLLNNGVRKQVVFFVAHQVSNEIKMQECEIKNIKWLSFAEAIKIISFDNTRELLQTILIENGYAFHV